MIAVYILLGILGLLLLLVLAAVIRTLSSPRLRSTYKAPPVDERAEFYAEKLSRMVAYETVSIPDTDQREKFLGFHTLLEELFPLVHQNLEKNHIF